MFEIIAVPMLMKNDFKFKLLLYSFFVILFNFNSRINNLINKGIKILNFNFSIFSLGCNDDKIINIIKIPPANSIVMILENHDLPASILIFKKIIIVVTNIRTLIFNGFFEFKVSALTVIAIILVLEEFIFLNVL